MIKLGGPKGQGLSAGILPASQGQSPGSIADPFQRYDPRLDGADCDHCPMKRWAGLAWAPVPAARAKGKPFGLLLGEAPAKTEVREGVPFCGESGEELNLALQGLAYPRVRWDIDNVIACQAPKNKYDLVSVFLKRDREGGKSPEWEKHPSIHCRPRLLKSLQRCQDIVPMGGKAAGAVLGGSPSILGIRGGPAEVEVAVEPGVLKALRVLPTVHPAFVRRKRRWRGLFKADLVKATRHFTGKLTWVDPGVYYEPTPEMIEWFVAQPSRWWDCDIETDRKDALTAQIRCMSIHRDPLPHEIAEFKVQTGQELLDVAMVIPFWSLDRGRPYYASWDQERINDILRRVFVDGRLWVGQNFRPYDCVVIERVLGVWPHPVADTMLLHRLCYSELPHSLGVIGSQFTDCCSWKQDNEGIKLAVGARNDMELWKYNAVDTGVTKRVFPILVEEVRKRGLDQPCPARPSLTLPQLDHRIQDACVQMYRNGVYIDQKVRAEMEEELARESAEKGVEVASLANHAGYKGDFNPNSYPQVRKVLYSLMKLEPEGYTESGLPSTNDTYLRGHLSDERLPEYAKHFIFALRGYRQKTKLLGFLPPMRPAPDGAFEPSFDAKEFAKNDEDEDDEDAWNRVHAKGLVRVNGRFHVSWKSHVPNTGRVSSSPNLQNLKKMLRKCIVAAPGHVLVSADAEQLESRIASARWGIQRYLDAFVSNLDAHQITMEMALGERIWDLEGAPPFEHRFHKRWDGGQIGGHFNKSRDLSKRFYYACFMKNTPVAILGTAGRRRIQDLVVGKDHTWTWDGEKYVPTLVIDKRCAGRRHCVRVTFGWGYKDRQFQETVVATRNHRFMLRDGNYKCAGDLQPGDRLMPFRRWSSSRGRVIDAFNNNGRQMEHRVAGGIYGKGDPRVIHHKDRNTCNNDPSNLHRFDTHAEHARLHWEEDDKHVALARVNADQWDDANREETNQRLTAGRVKSEKWQHAVRNCAEARSAGHKRSWASGKRKPRKQQASILDPYADIIGVLPDTVVAERAGCTVQNVYHYRKKRGIPPAPRARKNPNHTVVSVEPAGVHEVWDIEVDHPAHNFALASGIFVHNSQYGAEDETKLDVIRSATDEKGNLIYLNITLDAIAAMTRTYMQRCPELPKGWDMEVAFFKAHGYNMEPVTGRKRYFLDGFDRNEIVNFPIQSSGAGLMNIATIDVIDAGFTEAYAGPGTGLIQQGHDSLVLEVPEYDAPRAKEALESALTQYYPHIYDVRFEGEAAIGHSWYEVC